jgi:hypothetical protein
VGVPVGGTAGQFLQKTTTGVDYATDWTTVNLSVYAVKANNLSDLPSAPDARTNLGLGTMATATASDYSTTVAANGLYYPLSGNPSGFLTASSLTGYATESWVTGQGYITSAALTPYITSATATASFYPLSGNPSGFLTSAPVTSVAGRTGAITLSNTDISGLGSLAVVNDAPSDGSQYARKNAAWDVVISGDRYLTSSTTSNTVSNGNKTFTIGTGLSYTPTQNITISYDASNHMHGEVLTYNSGTGVLTVDINHHTGSGTYASWVVNVGGVTPATSVAWGAITGTLSTQTDLQSALDLKANLASPTFTGTFTTTGTTTNIGNTTAAQTLNIGTAGTLSGSTKSISIGEAGASGSTTLISIGNNVGAPSGVVSIAVGTSGGIVSSTTTLNGTTNGVTPAVDTNSVALATTAFVVGQAGSATPLVNGTAAVGTSLRYARQDHVHGTDTTRAPLASPTFTGTPLSTTAAVDTNTTQIATTAYVVGNGYLKSATASSTYAPLASPTFTGTPTLPTGTIATTQSPGDNTTALATTAFVTAAIPAFASTAQVVAATSTSTSLAPGNQGFLLTNPRLYSLAFINSTAISGSGAAASNTPQSFSRQAYLSTLAVGRASYNFGIPGTATAGFGTSTAKADQVDFSKKLWISGYACMGWTGGTSYIGDANTMCRISLGGYSTNTTGNMTLKGIGLKKVGGVASTVSLTVHNGTTLTDVASSVTVPDGGGIHWQIYSDGTGNVTLYINGTQAATTTAGPTTATASGSACYREQVEAVATPGVRQAMNANGGWFYTE